MSASTKPRQGSKSKPTAQLLLAKGYTHATMRATITTMVSQQPEEPAAPLRDLDKTI
jgi:hypothetical protein